MSYAADSRRAGASSAKVYGYATYAANRAPAPGGPGKSRATVTTAVVGPTRRSASATQYGLLDYDTSDFAAQRSTSRQSDDPSGWKPLRSAQTKPRKKSSSKAPPTAAELRERVRREVMAAGGAEQTPTDTADDDVSSDSDTAAPEALVHSRTHAHRSSPPRSNGHLVATPVTNADGSNGVTIHDASMPSEVTVEYTTRVLRRDDDPRDMSHTTHSTSARHSPNRSRQNASLEEFGRGAVQQYVSPAEQHATDAHFESRHPVAMTPVPVPISFDGAQQHQFDRIERSMDDVVASADASSAAVTKLEDDMRHRDAVRRAAEEERDVANASNIERIVAQAVSKLSDQTSEHGQVRLTTMRNALDANERHLTGVIEAESRTVLADQRERIEALSGKVSVVADKTESLGPQVVSAVAQMLVGDQGNAPACFESRVKSQLHKVHTDTVAAVQADLRHEVADAVRAITADREAADALAEAEQQRRSEETEQRLRASLLHDASHGREQQTGAILDTFDRAFTASKQASTVASTGLADTVRASAESTQDLVSRESARVRADVAAAMNDVTRVAQETAESRASLLSAAQHASEEQQRRLLASTEGALERHHRELNAAMESLTARISDKVATAALEQSPSRNGASLSSAVQGPIDGAVQAIGTAIERAERRREAAMESLPSLTTREVTAAVPSATVAALRPVLENELQATTKALRDHLDANASQTAGRVDRSVDQQQKAVAAAAERAIESAVKQATSSSGRDTQAALDTMRGELMRSFQTAMNAAADEAQRHTTATSDSAVSKLTSTIDSSCERLGRSIAERSQASLTEVAHKAAVEALQAARGETAGAVDVAVARSMEGRVAAAVTESLSKTRDAVKDAVDNMRREKETSDRRSTDEILSALRKLDASVMKLAQSEEEVVRETHASAERQRRAAEVEALRNTHTVTQMRSALEASDEAHTRSLDQLASEAVHQQDVQRERFASAMKRVREHEQSQRDEALATRDALVSHATELRELSAATQSLRSEREHAQEELERLHAAVEVQRVRAERFESETTAAEERRDQALMAAAAAEKDAGEVQSRLNTLREKESAAKVELARVQTQVSSVGALREVMLRDVQRLNGTGLTAASTRGPGSVGRSVGSTPAATPGGRHTEPHEA